MKSTLILPFAALASAMCDHRTSLYKRATEGVEGAVTVATFDYNDLKGPLNWHSHDNVSLCGTGKQQSPINLNDKSANLVKGSSLEFNVTDCPGGAVFENLGSTLEVVADNGTLLRDGRLYNLKQFHFHTPSEHRVDSEYYPMEVHFVFEADAEFNKGSPGPTNSVVGFLIEVDNSSPSPFLAKVFANLSLVAEPGSHCTTPALEFSELKDLLARSEVYQYDGSLTTPPCTEGIAWNVVSEPLTVDDATFRAAKKIMKFNSRYTQNVPGLVNLLDHSRAMLDSLPV